MSWAKLKHHISSALLDGGLSRFAMSDATLSNKVSTSCTCSLDEEAGEIEGAEFVFSLFDFGGQFFTSKDICFSASLRHGDEMDVDGNEVSDDIEHGLEMVMLLPVQRLDI